MNFNLMLQLFLLLSLKFWPFSIQFVCHTIFSNFIFVYWLFFVRSNDNHCHCHYEWNTIKCDYRMNVSSKCNARRRLCWCVGFCSFSSESSKLQRLCSIIAHMKTNEQTKALKAIFQYWICLNRISLCWYCCCLFVVPLFLKKMSTFSIHFL